MSSSPGPNDAAQSASVESFAAVFDSAVADSGLTLERLQDRLANEGIRISLATLSYWRRGRSLPEREQSLVAVRQLERILALRPGALTNAIGPKASRGRWTGRPPGALERRRLWPAARALITEFDAPPDGQMSVWSVHDQLVLDAGGRERLLRVRMTAEAVAPDVSRILVYYQSDSPVHPVPQHIDVRFCRLGQVRTDSASGLTVAELLLDHRLNQGEVTAVEYDIYLTPDRNTDTYYRRFGYPAGQYVCQIQFGTRVPDQISRYAQRVPEGPQRSLGLAFVGASRAVTVGVDKVHPGVFGLRWRW